MARKDQLYLVAHEDGDHAMVWVRAVNWELATVAAAELWGVPWGKVAAACVEADRKPMLSHICARCGRDGHPLRGLPEGPGDRGGTDGAAEGGDLPAAVYRLRPGKRKKGRYGDADRSTAAAGGAAVEEGLRPGEPEERAGAEALLERIPDGH